MAHARDDRSSSSPETVRELFGAERPEKQSEVLARAQGLARHILGGEAVRTDALVEVDELLPKLNAILSECSDNEIPHELVREMIHVLSSYKKFKE